jgi:DNA-binding MarR family transcriptional regulator
MPMPSSGIACEIIYLVAARASTQPACVKDLFLSLGYSEARVSEVLRYLMQDGWIDQRVSNHDKRKKFLYPSGKCLTLLNSAYSKEMAFLNSKQDTT